MGLRARRRRHVAVLDERRDRRVHRVRGRRADAAGLRGRAAGARARRRRSSPSTRTASAQVGRGRRAGHDRADAVDADLLLGRRRRLAAARELLRRCTPASGATATGSRSPTAARRSSTAARTRRSTAAGSAWARARSTARCWPIDDVVDALVVDVPREGTDGWMPLFVVLREGATLDDDLVARIKRRIREDCSPRHVPNEIHQIAEVPRTLSGKVLEVPVKRILMGQPPDTGRQPRVAGQPRGAGLLRGARRSWSAGARRRRRRPLSVR